jgi:hypothetical protein
MIKKFAARRGQAIACATLLSVLAPILCIGVAGWLSVGVGNPANRVIHALSDSERFRDEAARFFVEKLSEDSGTDATAVLDSKGEAVNQALSDLLGNEAFVRELDTMSDSAYEWFVNGDRQAASISIRPAVGQMVDTLSMVDPLFAELRSGLNDIEDVNLAGDDGTSPRLGRYLSTFSLGLIGVFLVSVLAALGYVRAARSPRGALKLAVSLLAVCSALLLGPWFAANRMADSVATSQDEVIGRIALPIVASTVTAPFRWLGIVCLVALMAPTALLLSGRSRRASTGH